MESARLNALAVVALSIVIVPGPAGAPSRAPKGTSPTPVCGAENPGARADVAALLTDEDEADARARVGLEDAEPRNLIRVTDARTCARLRRKLERTYDVRGPTSPYAATYYHVARRFIVHVIPREAVRTEAAAAGSVRIAEVKAALIVFDEAFEKLRTFLM